MAVTQTGTNVVKITSSGDTLNSTSNYWRFGRWVGGTTAGHKATIVDKDGNVFFDSEADGANFLDVQPIFDWFQGLSVSALDSGTVYLYRG